MKVAVLFYGRIKRYRETYEGFLQALNGVSVDIFYSCDAENDYDISEFKNLYKPVAVCNDKIKYLVDFSSFVYEPSTNIDNMTRHFINKMRVFDLLQTHIKETSSVYDIVLSTRLDIMYMSKINFRIIESDTIYIPENNDYYGLNDQIAYGNLEVMNIYMNIFNMALKLVVSNRSWSHPEILNKNSMKYNGIFVERFPLDYYIIR